MGPTILAIAGFVKFDKQLNDRTGRCWKVEKDGATEKTTNFSTSGIMCFGRIKKGVFLVPGNRHIDSPVFAMSLKFAIVDDSLFSRVQLRQKIQEWVPDAVFVEFGVSAQALAQIPGLDVDAVTLDLVMPDPDGASVLASLRGGGYARPIFIVSADIQDSTKDRCRSLGCTGFIEKPVRVECVQAMLKTLGVEV